MRKLFKALGIEGFSKITNFYSLFGGGSGTYKIIFFNDLKEVSDEGAILQMKEDKYP